VINYGLLGIKNLGSEFINDIIKERENGEYKDLFDFCSRLQTGHFNRRAVESLIRCGALDSLGANRRAMLQALSALVSNLEDYRRKTMYGQVGFFDLGTDDNAFGFDFELPNVDEFPKNELLKMEKEMTGLYLSGHPLDKYDDVISALGYARTVDLLEDGGINGKYRDGGKVSISGIISHITLKQTRNGANMAFVTIEDLYGSVEIIVFPNVLERYNQFLIQSSVITVFGTLSFEEEKDAKVLANVISGAPKRSDKPSNYAENQPKQESKKSNKKRGLFLRFDSKNDKNIEKAKNLISIFDGSYPLYFYYLDEKKYELQERTLFVDVNKTLLQELERILGNDNVAFIK
ncbi:MAG: DNA polymerase III subunit alpha, partial [Eubacterium sp.]|nr:DNA polymerase III subunit alpha [Eubacterium sp.]